MELSRYLKIYTPQKPLRLPHLFSDSSDEANDTMRNFIGLSLGLFLLTFITFIIWKKFLFEKYGAYIPIDKNIDVQQINKRKVLMSTKTFSVFRAMFMPLLNELKMDYWTTHVGVDGYLYLLFQRRFFRLTQYMSVISILAYILQTFVFKK